MSEKLTKLEWEEKIITNTPANFFIKSNTTYGSIEDIASYIWWNFLSKDTNSGMRLSKIGYELFKLAGITFYDYECYVPKWTGAITIGLTKINCPYYIAQTKNKINTHTFYVVDEEYAMLLMFSSNDLEMFAKGLT